MVKTLGWLVCLCFLLVGCRKLYNEEDLARISWAGQEAASPTTVECVAGTTPCKANAAAKTSDCCTENQTCIQIPGTLVDVAYCVPKDPDSCANWCPDATSPNRVCCGLTDTCSTVSGYNVCQEQCQNGETTCGKSCCGATEECVSATKLFITVQWCSAKTCAPGETLCPGEEQGKAFNGCCGPDQTCVGHGTCAEVPSAGSGSGGDTGGTTGGSDASDADASDADASGTGGSDTGGSDTGGSDTGGSDTGGSDTGGSEGGDSGGTTA